MCMVHGPCYSNSRGEGTDLLSGSFCLESSRSTLSPNYRVYWVVHSVLRAPDHLFLQIIGLLSCSFCLESSRSTLSPNYRVYWVVRSVLRAAAQRLDIIREAWQVIYDRKSWCGLFEFCLVCLLSFSFFVHSLALGLWTDIELCPGLALQHFLYFIRKNVGPSIIKYLPSLSYDVEPLSSSSQDRTNHSMNPLIRRKRWLQLSRQNESRAQGELPCKRSE